MQTQEAADILISRGALVSLIHRLTGGYSNDISSSRPPGPWDPVIRRALERTSLVGSHAEPWRIAVSALDRLNWVGLNPQPLPPRVPLVMALAQEMIDRTSLLYELADAFPEEGRAYVLEAAGSRLAHFTDDCSDGRIPLGWPFSWPPQGNSLAEVIDAIELVVMGVQFERAAATQMNTSLRYEFSEAGTRLIEAGLARMV